MTTRRQLIMTAATAPLWCRLGFAAQGTAPPLFDSHLHLITDDRVRYPRAAAAAPAPGAAPGAGTGMSAPAPGSTAGPNARGTRVTPQLEKVLEWMDANGVEGVCGVQYRSAYGYDNSYMLDSADRYPNRIVPVAVLDAQDPATPGKVRDYVKAHQLAGVRLTGMRDADGKFPWMDSDAAKGTWAVANELGLVIDLMPTPPGPQPVALSDFAMLARAYPNVRLVLDHVGWPVAEGAPNYGLGAGHQELAKLKNVYYKFTTINLDMLDEGKVDAPTMLRHVVDTFGADHVMWGSDLGNSAGTYDELVQRIKSAATKLTDAQRRAVLHDTAKAVFIRGGKASQRKAA